MPEESSSSAIGGGDLLPVPAGAAPPALGELPLPHYPAERNPTLVYLRRLRPSGRRSQRSALQKIARAISGGQLTPEELPWHVLRYEDTSAIRDWLAATHRPGTARSYLAALRGVLREAWRLEWMTTDQYMRAVDLDAISGSTVPRGRHVDGGEVRALFEHLAHDPRPIARRDAAALALLVGAGVRRSELAGLNREDLDTNTRRVAVRGKVGREQVAWLAPTALPAVIAWLQLRGDQPGPLLNPVLKGGRRVDRALSPQAVYDLCRKLAEAAAPVPATPRDFRATWTGATRQEVARLRAAARLRVPYVPPGAP